MSRQRTPSSEWLIWLTGRTILWQGTIARYYTMVMVLKAQVFSVWGKGQVKPGNGRPQMYEVCFEGENERDVFSRLSWRGQQ